MSDKVEDIVTEHSRPLAGGPVPVLHTDDPKPEQPEQPKPEPQPAQPQEVEVGVTVKPPQPAESDEKPDKD